VMPLDEKILGFSNRGYRDAIHSRFGYVVVSRASHEATIFTDNVNRLSQQLRVEVNKSSAPEFNQENIASRRMYIS
jgi:hypothetical protein